MQQFRDLSPDCKGDVQDKSRISFLICVAFVVMKLICTPPRSTSSFTPINNFDSSSLFVVREEGVL